MMRDLRLMSAADLDGLNERARLARTDQPEPEQARRQISGEVPEPEPVAEQMELML
jgi:hypothetical protein